ncbi:MAG: hypothetical protein JWM90_720 [Thermoleophilia bacterium]|nr:hypothetical protein [Thermoleophilia bacterium]
MTQRQEAAAASTAPVASRGWVASVRPHLLELALALAAFLAAASMGSQLLGDDVVRTLGDVQPGPASALFAGYLVFLVRARTRASDGEGEGAGEGDPTGVLPSWRELLLLAAEGALFLIVGTLTFVTWCFLAAWSLLAKVEFGSRSVGGWGERLPGWHALAHGALAGFTVGVLLAGGVEVRGGDADLTDVFGSRPVFGMLLGASVLAAGIRWGRHFERGVARLHEGAWTLWMLLPSLGAIACTLAMRDTYPAWATAAAGAVSLFVIAAHALVMGQRPRAAKDGTPAAAPVGVVRRAVSVTPVVATTALAIVLAVAGIIELVRDLA